MFLLLFRFHSVAQFWEAGGFVGGANYTGDLAGNLVLGETNLSFGALGRYNFNEYYSWRFGINYAKISGGDYNFDAYKYRNLSFFSHLWELDNRIEFNYRRFGTSSLAKKSSGFVFTGLNFFYFNPKTSYNGTVLALQPLGTEGQTLEGGKKYKRVGIAIPIGIGYKVSLSPNWVLGFEVSARKTFTDYLDDVSKTYPNFEQLQAKSGSTAVGVSNRTDEVYPYTAQVREGDFRGDPRVKDWYFQAGISLTYRFTPIRCMFSKY